MRFGFGSEVAGSAEHDSEGRLITAEFPAFFLVTAYVPNAGRGLPTLPKRLRWDPMFRQHLAELDKTKPVVVCGDLNVAHQEIDLKNPKTNKRNAGFTQEEREGMTELLELGLVDTFRHLHPEEQQFTFWTYMMGCRSGGPHSGAALLCCTLLCCPLLCCLLCSDVSFALMSPLL